MKAHILILSIVRWCFTTPARMSILKSAQLSCTDRVIELDGETFPYVTIGVTSIIRIRTTRANKKPSPMKAVQPDSASASAALLMRKGKHDAGRQLIT